MIYRLIVLFFLMGAQSSVAQYSTCQNAVNRLQYYGNALVSTYNQHHRNITRQIHPYYRAAYYQQLNNWYWHHVRTYQQEYKRVAYNCSCQQRRGNIVQHESPRIEVPQQTQNKRIEIPNDPIGLQPFGYSNQQR